jgi:multiple sugar transport system permease protein
VTAIATARPRSRVASVRGKHLRRLPYYVATAAIAAVFLYPMVWTLVSSFAPQPGTNQTEGWGFGNYATLQRYQDGIVLYFLNSLGMTAITVALTLLVSLLGGYAFARFSFPGKRILFGATLAILMVPYASLLIPLYVLLNRVSLGNSLLGVALVLTMLQLPFSIFMMRNSFEAIPKELDEAAQIDGCSSFTTLTRVLLPAVKPGLITVGLFAFLASWNDFLAPLILLNDSSKSTLPLAVANLRGQVQGIVDYGATEAGVVVLALPCVLLFLILQRHYVRGFLSGAFKG